VVDRQGSHVDLLPVWRPRNCRVISQISRLTYSDDQMALQRVVMNVLVADFRAILSSDPL
jgi:hypothetical protein